ncbi:hypothetical protein IAT38_006493 [Cryptococcus sp. DSM 104549]
MSAPAADSTPAVPTPTAPSAPTPTPLTLSPSLLADFVPTRTLSESTLTGSIFLLGTLGGEQAIVHLQRTVVPGDRVGEVLSGLQSVETFLENTPYYNAHAWQAPSPTLPHLVIKITCPATETHIRKHTVQERAIVHETRELYEKVVVPYMDSFDESRLGWVYAILEGKKEVERVLYRQQGPEGFVILPDLKWDMTSMNALYLTVLVETREIRTLRDLAPRHIPLLKDIRDKVEQTVKDKFDVPGSKLRLFVHHQPSYYHFHVHVVHIYAEANAGMMVGQAHLLDDIISLLELSPADGPSILARKSFTYPLGVKHGLYQGMLDAGAIKGVLSSPDFDAHPAPSSPSGEPAAKKAKLTDPAAAATLSSGSGSGSGADAGTGAASSSA